MKNSRINALLLAGLAGCAPAHAGSISISNTAPIVDEADIAQLTEAGHLDPGGDEGHVWSNRPLQGQTFTTGPNAGGYLLSSVTLRNEENTINNNTATFEVRIGTVSGTTFNEVASETSNNPTSYVPDDYVVFNFDSPVPLQPDTLYGFMWDTTGSGFTTWNNANSEYPDGEAFSSGGGGNPDDANLVFRDIDREFHLDLALNIVDDDDGDGLPNQWEIDNGLDPDDNGENPNNNGVAGNPDNGASGDPDGDLLVNSGELLRGSDPQDADTDDDMLSDNVETNTGLFVDSSDTGSDPNDADSDGDTLDDFSEIDPNPFVTDPNRADTDGDGIDDAAELAADPFETDPTSSDTDGDGWLDGVELAEGADPTDPNSTPMLNLRVASSEAPVVDGEDIAQLNETGHVDPGGDEGHIWANRPLQGQTFTTGPHSGGYLLRSVTLRNEENTVNNNPAVFEVRVGTVTGTQFTEVASASADNPISYVPNDWMTFVFGSPIALEPNTVYGFMWGTSGVGFTTWANSDTEYAGGEAFSSGAGGTPDDNNLIFRGVDREFHLDLEASGAADGPMLIDVERFGANGESIRITWESRVGRDYAIDSGVDLENWDFVVADELEATAETTSYESLIADLPQNGPEVYFRVRELVPPPALADDFESGQGGWTVGSNGGAGGTSWEFGAPDPSVTGGPAAANSGVNAFGTNLDGPYETDADIWLRSPPVDLAGAVGATLKFAQHYDIEAMFDAGEVRVLDASDNSELGIVQQSIDGVSGGWVQFSQALPTAALEKVIILEWHFVADDFGPVPQAGWYIDDVEVTVR